MALTEDLLQLHDAGIGADAVDGLRVPGIHALSEDLAESGIGIVFVGHVGDFESYAITNQGELRRLLLGGLSEDGTLGTWVSQELHNLLMNESRIDWWWMEQQE